MSPEDVSQMRQNISRFESSTKELSNGKMSISYDFITIQETL